MQGKEWKLGEVLGEGASCAVYSCESLPLPGVVLKRGKRSNLQVEGELHRSVDHPNVAKLYGIVSCDETEDGREVGYLAVERLRANLHDYLSYKW